MPTIKLGNVCVCQHGIVGIVSEIKTSVSKLTKEFVTLYKGVTLDGKPWQSVKPRFIANSHEEYNENRKCV